MLRRLGIFRFKSIRDENLEFGKVNLFIGGNGAGKSNLLEAIGLVSACLDRGLNDSDIGRKGMRISPPELMKSSFKNDDLPKTLELDADFDHQITYKCRLQSSEKDPFLRIFSESAEFGDEKVFGRSHRGASASGVSHADRLDVYRGIYDQIKATYNIPELVSAAFAEFSRYVIYSPQTDFLRGRQAGKVDVPPIGLHGEGLAEAASSILDLWRSLKVEKGTDHSFAYEIVSTCLDLIWLPGWASTFGVTIGTDLLTSRDLAERSSESAYFLDKYMHAKRNRLSVYDSSEGTLFLLFASIILSHPKAPKIFALDNVDNALNPRLTHRLVEQIINVCQSEKESGESEFSNVGAKQVFLTSHNPTALDAFDIFDEEQRVFVVSRNEKGHTIVKRMVPPKNTSKDEWDILKGGRNLSQVWLDGDIPGALGAQGL